MLVTRQLRFNTFGAKEVAPLTVADGTGVDIGRYRAKRAGYSVTGWYTDSAPSTRAGKVTITVDTTVYAGWRQRRGKQLPGRPRLPRRGCWLCERT